ncbi:hypothetical protein PF005_g5209 [Phytophthora fragariae]|uniref:Reverse transcriptase Ty1/copia-type domain-containing protein n=1 Tax=Phytophthora fragariae TaxID=53985 RepID=A0A6A4ABJ3_9STRA|nr:hypothetical protein PF011_g4213 [Phytophthora fragariae]KAE9226236.1 hypothetical protein PF005_g5209 [Phytophthora fragariae]KAE9252471.1 hypothetical protein PF002_g3816 [Phytophthora fragariae]
MVFKKKLHADGSLDKYKACVVANGFSQPYGDDYTKSFSPVAYHSTVRLVAVVVVQRQMKRMQLDIKTVFLNSKLNEEIYLDPVEGITSSDGHVWRRCKAEDLVYVDDILAFATKDEDLSELKAAVEDVYDVNNHEDIKAFATAVVDQR